MTSPSSARKTTPAKKNVSVQKTGTQIETYSSVPEVGSVQYTEYVESTQVQTTKDVVREEVRTATEKYYRTSASQVFWSVLRQVLNQLAYDMATWIGSGGEGQQPMFVTEGWGSYLGNIADAAGGAFLEEMGQNWGVDLCKPSLDARMKMGLGLANMNNPMSANCTFSEALSSWNAVGQDDYISNLASSIQPNSSDFGVSLNLFGRSFEYQNEKTSQGALERLTNRDLKTTKNADDSQDHPAEVTETAVEEAYKGGSSERFLQNTGDAFIDALNIFINQLIVTLIRRLMTNMGGDDSSGGGSNDDLLDPEAEAGRGGIAAAKERLYEIIQPRFDEPGDFEILAQLTTCDDPTNAGPTDCVIEDRFREAVMSKLTVGQAIDQGYLKADAPFGFITGSSGNVETNKVEPEYNQGYPYRSIIILRKYRIVPVGWEMAALETGRTSTDHVGIVTLGQLVACFENGDAWETYEGKAYNTDASNWCRGLVDPDWVLKAPQNICRRSGYGPAVVSEEVSEGDSQLTIIREQDYCADEQSCIKEKDDGSCEYYGYCTEEKRAWNFGAKACLPEYNTCQTFSQAGGKTASFLENTLQYCTMDGAGCKAYAVNGSYYENKSNDYEGIQWTGGETMYFNQNAAECDDDEDGCQQLVRAKSGYGANFILNGGFESEIDLDLWNGRRVTGDAGGDSGTSTLVLDGNTTREVIVGPADYLTKGETYTLSFYAYNCTGRFSLEDKYSDFRASTTNTWDFYSLTYTFDINSANDNKVRFTLEPANAGACRIDAAKLEVGKQSTTWTEYGQQAVVYERLIPPYYASACYQDAANGNWMLKADAPKFCDNYARRCSQSEAGCVMYYDEEEEDFSLTAQTKTQDLCPKECVGYDMYIQRQTPFDSARPTYFIPKTAKNCQANVVGCDEFTNLDDLGSGAEQKEYYAELKQCVKPEDPLCTDFYTWEGSQKSGFQMKSYKLKRDTSGGPATTEDMSAVCSEAIYNLTPDNPSYNPQCLKYYDSQGNAYYRVYTKTITCSDNCHPYRRTAKNANPALTSASACSGNASFHWDSAASACYECRAGGTWSDQHQACIYQAIPGEGQKCSAAADGCREYSGRTGSQVKELMASSFENGGTGGWEAGGTSGEAATLSSEALKSGEHSLLVKSSARYSLNWLLDHNSSYYLFFLAKVDSSANNSVNLNISISNGNSSIPVNSETIVLAGEEWKLYKVNLEEIPETHEISTASEYLAISAGNGGSFFIDDIHFKKISQRYFKIAGSWNTPTACDTDYNGQAYQQYALGCSAYTDADSDDYYLKSFTHLCHDYSAGCEVMLDTRNSSSSREITIKGVTVPADQYIYAIYDQDKSCEREVKGCRAYGLDNVYESQHLYQDYYIVNDPDRYESILCSSAEVGCEAWTKQERNSKTTVYVKNPGNMACEWRKADKADTTKSWLRTVVKRCDLNGDEKIDPATETSVCLRDSDCQPLSGASDKTKCIEDTNNYPCPVNDYDSSNQARRQPKTFGEGGLGNEVYQPIGNWAGYCAAESSGCTEYIDPVSSFSSNLIFNSRREKIAGVPDAGWTGNNQIVILEPNTLYTLEGVNFSLTCPQDFYVVNQDNSLSTVRTRSASNSDGARFNFYIMGDSEVQCTVHSEGGANAVYPIALRQAIVSYRLSDEVDYASCNGAVNFDTGCVLFNERQIDSASSAVAVAYGNYADLIWDAKASYSINNTAKSPKSGHNNDTNILLKVAPDRACGEWLTCLSMAEIGEGENKEKACYDIGACNRMGDDGQCVNITSLKDAANSEPEEQVYDYGLRSKFANVSGYSRVGFAYDKSEDSKALYHLSAMRQVGELAQVANGNFESYNEEYYPYGWRMNCSVEGGCETAEEVADSLPALNCTPYTYANDENIRRICVPAEQWPACNEADPTAACPATVFQYLDPDSESLIPEAEKITETLIKETIADGICGQYSPSLCDYNVASLPPQCRNGNENSACLMSARESGLICTRVTGVTSGVLTWSCSCPASWDSTKCAAYKVKYLSEGGNGGGAASQPDEKDSDWSYDKFGVIDDPVWNQSELGTGAKYPIEGRSYLGYTSEDNRFAPRSEIIELNRGETYTLTYWINTMNLKKKDTSEQTLWLFDNNSGVRVKDATGNFIGKLEDLVAATVSVTLNATHQEVRATSLGKDWHEESITFVADSDQAYITLGSSRPDSSTGKIYIDDLRIKPQLKAGEGDIVKQECRLYPGSDSLSCDYYESSGNRQIGWPGYCLQHDRYPGNPDNCLLWYPVDRVKGDGVYDSGAGYKGWSPLYYCSKIASRDLEIVEWRQSVPVCYDGCSGDNCQADPINDCQGYLCAKNQAGGDSRAVCPNGYRSEEWNVKKCFGGGIFGGNSNASRHWCIAIDGGWQKTDGDLQSISGSSGAYDEASIGYKLRDTQTQQIFNIDEFPYLFYCLELANTVTVMGQNKAWMSRIYDGSTYEVPDLKYTYDTYLSPYGTVGYPEPIDDPFLWDTDSEKNGKQPLSLPQDYEANLANSGMPYSCGSVNGASGQGACRRLGRCAITGDFCYEIETPVPEGAVHPIEEDFKNPWTCPEIEGNVCASPFSSSTVPSILLNLEEGVDRLKRLFARNYGYWTWNEYNNNSIGRYLYKEDAAAQGLLWTTPTKACPETGRPDWDPAGDKDYCGFRPMIYNIQVNGIANQPTLIRNTGFINLSFNTLINPNQAPMTMYSVDWGEGSRTTVSGVSMNDRPSTEDVHNLYHLYSYWSMRMASNASGSQTKCGNADQTINVAGMNYKCPANSGGCCASLPGIKVKDNWGWCNNGVDGAPCPTGGNNEYEPAKGLIVVTQR